MSTPYEPQEQSNSEDEPVDQDGTVLRSHEAHLTLSVSGARTMLADLHREQEGTGGNSS